MCEYGFAENVDYAVTDKNVRNSNGGKQTIIDHQITLDMAKEICMLQRSEKGKQFRQYFIEVEKAWRKSKAIDNKALAIVKIVNANNDIEQALAIKEYTKLIETPLQEKIEEQNGIIETQKPKCDLADLRISAYGCYTITDVNKTFNLKKGRITGLAKALGMLHKTQPEVNKKGEGLFKVYSKDGKYNQIGITDKGLSWVRENLTQLAY
jgi:anti-repressor protein